MPYRYRNAAHLTFALLAILIAVGLTACGDSRPSGFTARSPPPSASDFSTMRPTTEMAKETETLLVRQHPAIYRSPKCVPADSLDGVGEFNFKCTAKYLGRSGRTKLGVVVFGSASGEPELGPVIAYVPHIRRPGAALSRRGR